MKEDNNSFLTLLRKSNKAFTFLLTLAFLVFGFIGILNHEMWGDEIQAWLIARDSSSISELFKNLRYESHPGLWHACLYLITRLTHNPIAMQLFHLLLATSVIYIFVKCSPFTKLQKVLFSFGYFPFYEYSLISRNYGIGVLLIFSFCALFQTRKQSYFLLASVLFLLANTNIYALIITIALSLTLLFDCIINRKALWALSARKVDTVISIIIAISGVVNSVIQIIPPADSSFETNGLAVGWTTGLNIQRLQDSILTIWISYIPIPNFSNHGFWNTNILIPGDDTSTLIGVVSSLGLFVFFLGLFIKKPVALFLYFSGTIGILLFEYFKFIGWMRHYGHLFILLIACLWISSYYSQSVSSRTARSIFTSFFRISVIASDFYKKYRNKFITLLLCTHVVAGTFAFVVDLYEPFSVSKRAARFIQTRHMDNMLIAGTNDYAASTLSGYLDKKIYYPNVDRFGSFIIWNKENKKIDSKELLEKTSKLITQLDKDILLVSSYKLNSSRPDISIFPLANFNTETVGSYLEKCYLYLIRSRNS